MIEIQTARKIQLRKEFWQALVLPEGVNQPLLPVGQELQVDAQAFFKQFIGLAQGVLLKAQSSVSRHTPNLSATPSAFSSRV